MVRNCEDMAHPQILIALSIRVKIIFENPPRLFIIDGKFFISNYFILFFIKIHPIILRHLPPISVLQHSAVQCFDSR